jgi:3'(2'), 5'-bisphosphate nucleotidase
MQSSNGQLSREDITYVDKLAREGGRLALEMRQGVNVKTKTGPSDFVTDADLHISRLFIQELTQRFPDDLVVSEEDQVVGSAICNLPEDWHSRRIWIIDPIDGTENYINQDGQYTCMIGLLHNGTLMYGWIFQPTTNTLFYGGPGHGAWKQCKDAQPIEYSGFKSIESAPQIRLMMGWSDRRHSPWVMDLPRVRYVKSDSLGLKIVKILEDEADIFVNLNGRVKLWDTAAPAAIALGAGLDVGTIDGPPLAYPLPRVQHGSSVIIGRPGCLDWAIQNLHGRSASSK